MITFTPGEARDFWTKVNLDGPRKAGIRKRCWIWTAYISKNGYGKHRFRNGQEIYAHRISFVVHKEPIPEDMEIDHICRTRHCVRPSHLRAVTHRENMLCGETIAAKQAAQTHCKHGHPLSGSNLYSYGRSRQCRACRSAAMVRLRTRIAERTAKSI